MKFLFENTAERLARIVARKYNVTVVFEGNEAKTDGKTIWLPYIKDMTADLLVTMDAYLDHEVAHIRYTDFEFGKANKPINKLHAVLDNLAEDLRIEPLMIADYPGCKFHLGPLRDNWWKEHNARTHEMEFPWKIMMGIANLINDTEPYLDDEIKPYIEMPEIIERSLRLRDCKSSPEIYALTKEIAELIKKEYDENPPPPKPGDKEKKEKKKQDKKDEKARKKKAKEEGQDGDGEPQPGSDAPSQEPLTEDNMFDECKDADKKEGDVTDHVNGKIKDHLDKSAKKLIPQNKVLDPIWEGKESIPITTRFDRVTDHSGKGDYRNYMHLRGDVQPMISSIKNTFERILKVKENVRWQTEREMGKINQRSLFNLAVDQNYRTPFKEYRKEETNNVAMQILIDMSGSMYGKTSLTKMAAIAMGEALSQIQIPFEVTGFYSDDDHDVQSVASGVSPDGLKRFNRMDARLELHVFKSFASTSLTGIERIFSDGHNDDGECVVWAAKRLAFRKEKRKILMVLSDGQPMSHGNRGILCSDLRNKVRLIGQSGIECVGCGIRDNAVKEFYPDYVIINDLRELPNMLMTKLSKIIVGNY